jgi:RNA recognition motif-containing protein
LKEYCILNSGGGSVVKFTVPKNNGSIKGFAYITFENELDAERFIKACKTVPFKGFTLYINFMRESP